MGASRTSSDASRAFRAATDPNPMRPPPPIRPTVIVSSRRIDTIGPWPWVVVVAVAVAVVVAANRADPVRPTRLPASEAVEPHAPFDRGPVAPPRPRRGGEIE